MPETMESGDCLVQQLMISMDPTHSIWMRKIVQYSPCVGVGNIMRASGVGRVVKTSDEAKMPVGSYVVTFAGIAEYLIMAIDKCTMAAPDVPLSWNLGPLFFGMGHTAWVGNQICAIKPGDTYVVSGAAGAVGSIAGQLAKMVGARVIGIAGGPAKCAMLVDELGFDGAVDYKKNNVGAELDALCPNGIDCYFDNVGGSILDCVFTRMNCFGRIAFCGAISSYSGNLEEGKTIGPANYNMILMRRLRIQGFLCRDHSASKPESTEMILQGIKDGKIKFKEDVRETSVEDYVDTLNLLFSGGNTGKLIMKIAD